MKLNDIISPVNYHSFYTPMATCTEAMLDSLATFIETNPEQSQIGYHKQLLQCQLDYSLASLKRLDRFLKALRAQRPINHLELADNPKISALFYFLIAYVGEVFSRARNEAACWFAIEQITDFDTLSRHAHNNFTNLHFGTGFYPENTTPELERAFVILFNNTKTPLELDNIGYFLPVRGVYQNLIADEPLKSIYDEVTHYLEASEANLPNDGDIPDVPKQYVDVDLSAKLANFKPEERYYLQIKKPNWLNETDKLYPQIKHLSELYKGGRVVWAALIQANNKMLSSINSHLANGLPGEIVFDPTGRTHIRELIDRAEEIFSLKNTEPENAEQLALAQRITAETEYTNFADYPKSLSPLPLKISTVFLWRHHFPNGLVTDSMFPILIDDKLKVVTPLPFRFWQQDFVNAWLENGEAQIGNRHNNLLPMIRKLEDKGLPSWKITSNSIKPEEFLAEDLYPKLTELFPEHQYPTKAIIIESEDSNPVNVGEIIARDFALLDEINKIEDSEERQKQIDNNFFVVRSNQTPETTTSNDQAMRDAEAKVEEELQAFRNTQYEEEEKGVISTIFSLLLRYPLILLLLIALIYNMIN